jgi:hypothetical protein
MITFFIVIIDYVGGFKITGKGLRLGDVAGF